MATAESKVYGSITIIDVGDVGTLSVYPESNLPTQIVYIPDTDTYVPDWNDTPLTLTANIMYGAKPPVANSYKVTWKTRKTYSNQQPADAILAENQITNSITIQSNIFKAAGEEKLKTITYTCIVTYNDPETGAELTAAGQISFSKLQQSSTIAKCELRGENVVKYTAGGQPIGSSIITLRADLANCTLLEYNSEDAEKSGWAWRGYAGNAWSSWAPIDSANANPLSIDLNTSIYSSYVQWEFRIKAILNAKPSETIYDTHSIIKLQDGADGAGLYGVGYDQEDVWIATDVNGAIPEGALAGKQMIFWAQKGGTKLERDYVKAEIITADSTAGGLIDNRSDNNTDFICKVTSWPTNNSTNEAKISFNVTVYDQKKKTDGDWAADAKVLYETSKTFNLTKLRAGQNGKNAEAYDLKLSPTTVNIDANGNLSTEEIHLSTQKVSINAQGQTVREEYNSVTYWYKTSVDGEWTKVNGNNIKLSNSIMYLQIANTPQVAGDNGSFPANDMYDTDSVTITSDGKPAYNVIFDNAQTNIPCSAAYISLQTLEMQYKIEAFKGTSPIGIQSVADPDVNDFFSFDGAITDNDNVTGIKITFKKGANYFNNPTQIIPLTITLTDGTTIEKSIAFTAQLQGDPGQAATFLQIYPSGSGNVIVNGENEVQLTGKVYQGNNEITNSGGFKWTWEVFDFSKGGYADITDTTNHVVNNNILTVKANGINNYASFKLIAYKDANNNNKVDSSETFYEAYYSVYDKTDPLTITMMSSIGDKIVNSQGRGVLYSRVMQQGEDIDYTPLKYIGTTDPKEWDRANLRVGDLWLAIVDNNTNAYALRVYSWTGSAWHDEFDPNEKYKDADGNIKNLNYNYTWTFLDKDGKKDSYQHKYLENSVESVQGKFLYIDGAVISKKKQFNLTVEKKPKSTT